MSNWNSYKNIAADKFCNHIAILVCNDGRHTVIDWRNKNGSSDHYINFIVDKQIGSLIITGDLGSSIAAWYHPMTVSELKSCIDNDIEYYIGKMQCTTNNYHYETEFVFQCMEEYLEKENMEHYCETHSLSYHNFTTELKSIIHECIYKNQFQPSAQLSNIVEEIDPDAWEWLRTCGQQIDQRVYMWAIGFIMACDQLNL